jgi:hypothetical protein
VEKQELVEKLMAMVRLSLETPLPVSGFEPCERYGDADYQRIVDEVMSIEDLSAFVTHSEYCRACQIALARKHLATKSKARTEMTNVIYRKTMDLLDTLEMQYRAAPEVAAASGSPSPNLFRIVLERVKEFWRVMETTGTILSMPEPVAVRGPTEKLDKSAVRVLQEIASPPLSVQVRVSDIAPDRILIKASLFDSKREEFIRSVKIELQGAGTKQIATSDDSGEVSFELAPSGTYELNIHTAPPVSIELQFGSD